MTVYEENGRVDICYDNENIEHMSVQEFLDTGMTHLLELKTDIFIYNLSFWGLAIIYRLRELGYEDITEAGLVDGRKCEDNEFSYVCSRENGSFYTIRAGKKTRFYEFLNLCSIETKDLVETFGEPNTSVALAMHRCVLSVRGMGTRAATISSAAYAVWKKCYDRYDFNAFFKTPDPECPINVRDAYFGGLSYLKRGIERRETPKGGVVDCNSLYPFVMSTRRMPTGAGHYEKGEPSYVVKNSRSTTYFVHFRATFDIKPGKMPFVKSKVDKYHWADEVLETSDICDRDGNRFSYYEDVDTETGEIIRKRITCELVLYKADFELFFEQYDVHEIEYIDYVWYNTSKIFDKYVTKFYEMKKNAKTKGERRIAKMFQNALSGRMALKTERQSILFTEKSYDMMARYRGDIRTQRGKKTNHYMGESVMDYSGQVIDVEMDSETFPQIGAAITSEARAYMVRKIQANWRRFLYTDTDSIHFFGTLEDLVDITISDELGDFKVEHTFDRAVYFKSKTYILYNDSISRKPVYITMAGLPDEVKEILEKAIECTRVYSILPENYIKFDKRVPKYLQKRFFNQIGTFPSTGHIEIPREIKKWNSYSPAKIYYTTEMVPIDIYTF